MRPENIFTLCSVYFLLILIISQYRIVLQITSITMSWFNNRVNKSSANTKREWALEEIWMSLVHDLKEPIQTFLNVDSDIVFCRMK